MSWLRLDDSFDTHPKIVGLRTDERRWTWQRVLIYTTRYRSDEIPSSIRDVIAKATPAFLTDCVKLELIDIDEHGIMHVHDWADYNGADSKIQVRERVRRHRQRDNTVTPSVTDSVTDSVTKPLLARRHPPASRLPNPLEQEHDDVRQPKTPRDPVIEARLVELVSHTDWTPRQLELAGGAMERAVAWLEAAGSTPGLSRPWGWAWQGFSAGASPPAVAVAPAEPRAVDPSAPCPGCGAKLGAGHLDDCPKVAEAVAAAAVAEPVESEEERERRLASMVTGAAGLLRSLRPEPPTEEAA